MKKRTLISLLCAGVLTVGAVTGLTGFAQKNDDAQEKANSTFTLLSTAEDETEEDTAEVTADGTITGVSDVAAKVMPAVVSITNRSVTEVQDIFSMYGMYGYGRGNQPRTYEYESESVGSGIIIAESDTELLICTNYHVVEDATEITVGFIDDSVCKATLKGSDASNDLAVVAVSLDDISGDTLDQISVAEIGDSDKLLVGQQVVAIGNALGYGQSVTTGIVSALNRTIDLDGYNANLIQTDAAINPGNSGGALLDMRGRVIGINSAKAAANGVEGMGYAIPISYAKPILEDLMNKVTRTETVSEDEKAFIGITGQGVTDEFSQLYGVPQGIYVTDITEGSPAEEAGLKKGDVITKFDGSSVLDMDQLRTQLAYYAAGETVEITVQEAENGEYKEIKMDLTLGAAADYQQNTYTEEDK